MVRALPFPPPPHSPPATTPSFPSRTPPPPHPSTMAPHDGRRGRGALAGTHSNANRPLLLAQLALYGTCVPVDLDVVADNTGHGDAFRRQPPAAVGKGEFLLM